MYGGPASRSYRPRLALNRTPADSDLPRALLLVDAQSVAGLSREKTPRRPVVMWPVAWV